MQQLLNGSSSVCSTFSFRGEGPATVQIIQRCSCLINQTPSYVNRVLAMVIVDHMASTDRPMPCKSSLLSIVAAQLVNSRAQRGALYRRALRGQVTAAAQIVHRSFVGISSHLFHSYDS